MTATNTTSIEETTPNISPNDQNGNGTNSGANNGPPKSTFDMNIGHVRGTGIVDEMQSAYLDYAMSVIVSRALPDVRDGLKPVHRRILYAMYHDLGLTFNKPHKKSARIVGEVLGKYHPHGDTAVYEAMARMAQDFSLRYPLVDGQGNFGSIDGDNPAAMRYTEARLAELSDLMLADLEKDTVDWRDNFDNSLLEPIVLPAAFPNLLVNGASGIAVGMATNIPPHNLGEIIDALAFIVDNYKALDEITVEQLLEFVKGPDFPTGGILYRYREEKNEETDVIAQGYAVGKARLILQAKAHFEEMSRNRMRIVITELPYQTNKVSLLERIAALVRDGKLEGITDLRDESDRTGMRVVIELTRNAEPKRVLEKLFKLTPLQQTFGMQMLSLVDGEPRTLSLKRMLHLFIQHREEVIRRRSEFDLARARERAHILEGLLKALDILDEVIATIRNSQRVDTARNNLIKNFGFTQIQAQAILDMQLRRLAALERKKLQDEYKELLKQIKHLENLLAHPEKILALIKKDLLDIKEKYADERRTQIVDRTKGTLTSTDLLPQQDVWVSVGSNGNLRRKDVDRRTESTLIKIGKNAEVALMNANTRDYLYLFNKDGRCCRAAIHELPQNGTNKHLAELTDFTRRDTVNAAISLPRITADEAQGYLFLVTKLGMVKRVSVADFIAASAMDSVVMSVEPRDELLTVLYTQGEQETILVSATGNSIRFSETDVRSMGLAAGGIGGMKLKKGDTVIYASIVESTGELMTITENGFAKRTALNEYNKQGRNGGGIITHKPNRKTGNVIAAQILPSIALQAPTEEYLIVTLSKGPVKTVPIAAIPEMGRNVQGKQVVPAGLGTTVRAATMILDIPTAPLPDDDPNNPTEPEPTPSGRSRTNGNAKPGTQKNSNSTNGRSANNRSDKEPQSNKARGQQRSSAAPKSNATTGRTSGTANSTSTQSGPQNSQTAKSRAARSQSTQGTPAGSSTASKSSRKNQGTSTRSSASARASTKASSKDGVKNASTGTQSQSRPTHSRPTRAATSRGTKSAAQSATTSKDTPKSTSKTKARASTKVDTNAKTRATAQSATNKTATRKTAAKKSPGSTSTSNETSRSSSKAGTGGKGRKTTKSTVNKGRRPASTAKATAQPTGKTRNSEINSASTTSPGTSSTKSSAKASSKRAMTNSSTTGRAKVGTKSTSSPNSNGKTVSTRTQTKSTATGSGSSSKTKSSAAQKEEKVRTKKSSSKSSDSSSTRSRKAKKLEAVVSVGTGKKKK